MSDPIPNLENMTSELSYTELVGIFAPLYDVSTMLGHLKPSIIDSSSEEYYQAIIDKLARSREPLRETIANLEQEHPSVFGLLDS
jgi:hypothetical protein